VDLQGRSTVDKGESILLSERLCELIACGRTQIVAESRKPIADLDSASGRLALFGGSVAPCGFGLLLAKKQVDDLIYNEKANDVLLIKYLNPATFQSV